jgi:hypothetical protein
MQVNASTQRTAIAKDRIDKNWSDIHVLRSLARILHGSRVRPTSGERRVYAGGQIFLQTVGRNMKAGQGRIQLKSAALVGHTESPLSVCLTLQSLTKSASP